MSLYGKQYGPCCPKVQTWKLLIILIAGYEIVSVSFEIRTAFCINKNELSERNAKFGTPKKESKHISAKIDIKFVCR